MNDRITRPSTVETRLDHRCMICGELIEPDAETGRQHLLCTNPGPCLARRDRMAADFATGARA